MSSFKRSSRHSVRQETRLVATALIAQDDHLLLVQLARGRFAGYWLLPSATVEDGAVAETAWRLVPERTGCQPVEQQLAGVLEEPATGLLVLRFAFATRVEALTSAPPDPEITQARWVSRTTAREILGERDLVPTLGVMHLVRNWADGAALPPLTTLDADMPCPCGTSYSYRGCCGWDARQ